VHLHRVWTVVSADIYTLASGNVSVPCHRGSEQVADTNRGRTLHLNAMGNQIGCRHLPINLHYSAQQQVRACYYYLVLYVIIQREQEHPKYTDAVGICPTLKIETYM